jgi:EAL domain-containing protein (putative c-di-GMP-specific phosphodiesterase class I)
VAGALDLDVVAEGIERPEQVELLRDAGCPAGQGYLFSRPQPLPQTLATLRDGVAAPWATSTR